jgi:hypothetical protein
MIYLYKLHDLGYVRDYIICIYIIRTTKNTKNDKDNDFS